MVARPPSPRDAGQANVEAALTLPLLLFLVLGTLQLFMLLQARIFAQYAAYKAVHAGSVLNGDCAAMTHAALVAVLPTITRTDSPASLVEAFRLRNDNHYRDGAPQHTGHIVELVRESPDPASVPASAEDEDNGFDQPGAPRRELTVRMLYWYRLRIPFADWVMGRMFLAHFSLQSFTGPNPLMVAQRANWTGEVSPSGPGFSENWPGGSVAGNLLNWAGQGQYLFPIRVSASMRMMQPPRKRFFADKACPL